MHLSKIFENLSSYKIDNLFHQTTCKQRLQTVTLFHKWKKQLNSSINKKNDAKTICQKVWIKDD